MSAASKIKKEKQVKQHVKQQLRSDFLDRIRVILTVLVILHHVAITYGAEGGWYLRYKAGDLLSGASLTLFCAVNQSFFMEFSFFILFYKISWQYYLQILIRFFLT